MTNNTLTVQRPTRGAGTKQAANELCVSTRTLHNWAERGLIPPPRRIGRKWIWDMDAIRARLVAKEVPV
jgi:predicted site-specific integrase-resolvase